MEIYHSNQLSEQVFTYELSDLLREHSRLYSIVYHLNGEHKQNDLVKQNLILIEQQLRKKGLSFTLRPQSTKWDSGFHKRIGTLQELIDKYRIAHNRLKSAPQEAKGVICSLLQNYDTQRGTEMPFSSRYRIVSNPNGSVAIPLRSEEYIDGLPHNTMVANGTLYVLNSESSYLVLDEEQEFQLYPSDRSVMAKFSNVYPNFVTTILTESEDITMKRALDVLRTPEALQKARSNITRNILVLDNMQRPLVAIALDYNERNRRGSRVT
jgi:hypothetical protein